MTNVMHRIGTAATAFAACAAVAATSLASDRVPWTDDKGAQAVWMHALSGDGQRALQTIEEISVLGGSAIVASVEQRRSHIASAEKARDERVEEVRGELQTHLADNELNSALRDAVEFYTLSIDKKKAITAPEIQQLVKMADAGAKRAEAEGQWLEAHELLYRLNLLYAKDGRYREDTNRIGRRLVMLRKYTPKKLHDMRNAQRIAEGEDELPPFNDIGEDWLKKLDGVHRDLVTSSVMLADRQHVDDVGMKDMLLSGVDAVRTFVTTHELADAFPKLRDAKAVAAMGEKLDAIGTRVEKRGMRAGYSDLRRTMSEVIEEADAILSIPEAAIAHEFGNGAMGALDDYSSIIWPDEIRQFQRSVQGKFTGVGVQIQLDEAKQLKVVTPLDGTPAQRAGIRRGDLIRNVDGAATLGMTLQQAVERISGPRDTKVVLTIERQDLEEPFDIEITRAVIPIYSVKGWRRAGQSETDWDWFIDSENGIGYVRLTQFTEDTSSELRRAVVSMQNQGLEGLILDLRYNPGGLLDEAVNVVSMFVSDGVVVSTHDAKDHVQDIHRARRGRAVLADLPVAVLVNEGSASASEIVSGALQDYNSAVIVGSRSFGKGSVQNVFPLTPRQTSAMKLTTQYYKLPDGRLIHRRPGDSQWGIEPDVVVDMTPTQIMDSLLLRQDADVLAYENDDALGEDEPKPDPERLHTEGIDTQLETALLLLRSQLVGFTPKINANAAGKVRPAGAGM